MLAFVEKGLNTDIYVIHFTTEVLLFTHLDKHIVFQDSSRKTYIPLKVKSHIYESSISQKAACVSPLISWLPTLQPQHTPIEHYRESSMANLAVHYYRLFLIERHNIWPNNLHGWKDELPSFSEMSLN